MKIHARIAIFLLLCTGAFERAWADTVMPIESVGSFVNIRMAADAASEVVGRLHKGSQLPYVRTVDGWYEVELEGGGAGFISAEWASIVADEDEFATPATGEEPAVEIEPEIATAAESAPETTAVPDPAAEIESVADAAPDSVASEEVPATGESAATPAEDAPVASPAVEAPALPQSIEGPVDYLVKFRTTTEVGKSQIFDNGRNVGIGTDEPQQRLEVNGNIQIHERNSGVAGLLITQDSGDSGYIMHNRGNTLTIGAGSVDRLTITRDGNVGFGVNRPAHPIEMASGAHVSAGGVWTDSSSIDKKENVRNLTPEEAFNALAELEPVRFNYKADQGEEYVGFIAEEVPELVATAGRTGLSAMDIVAVLTSVVQQQQKQIDALDARLDRQSPGN